MTIDEAIVCERNHRLYPEYHEQLTEWLEDLKKLREEKSELQILAKDNYEIGIENGYNKAIADFANACEKQFTRMYGQRYVDMRDIKKIAEQLKQSN